MEFIFLPKYFAQMLNRNKTLTHLYLNQNEITDNGIRILTDALENHNKTIENLDLFENKSLTDGCIDHLLSMIKHNQSKDKIDWIAKIKEKLRSPNINSFLKFSTRMPMLWLNDSSAGFSRSKKQLLHEIES